MSDLHCTCPRYQYQDGTIRIGLPVEDCPMHGRARVEHVGPGRYQVSWPDAPVWPIPNWDEPEHAPEELL